MKRKKTLYYVETDFGCTLDAGRKLEETEKEVRNREGQYFRNIRRATKKDVAWIVAMGGYVPEGVAR